MYIGSPLQDLPDLEEKLSIFIARYNYDPMLYSPNENPEMELAFQAGDYLYIYGDVDEVCAEHLYTDRSFSLRECSASCSFSLE